MGFDPAVYQNDGQAVAYMKRRAAREGDKTEHGDPVRQGSANVFINNRPACRTQTDPVGCQQHGDEVVLTGSDTVFINAREAVREFDMAEGGGPPDAIVEGSDNVSIGSSALTGGVGMDSDALAAEYCKELCQLVKDWPNLSTDQRRDRVQALADWLSDRSGLPRSTVHWGGGAQFHKLSWSQTLPADSLSKPTITPGEFGGNLYHETRHGQQYYLALRYLIAKKGYSNSATDIAVLTARTGVHPSVIARALAEPRLSPQSREYRFGRLMHTSLLSGRGHEPKYHLRAHERDGRLVGYRGNCHGCC